MPLGYLGQEAEKGEGEGQAGQCRLTGPGTAQMGLVGGVCSSAPGPAHSRNGCPGCTTLGTICIRGLQFQARNVGSLLQWNFKSPIGPREAPLLPVSLVPGYSLWFPYSGGSTVSVLGESVESRIQGLVDRKHLSKVTQQAIRSPMKQSQGRAGLPPGLCGTFQTLSGP